MTTLGIISDTHSHLDPAIYKYFKNTDEVWHAGDIGDPAILDDLRHFKPTKAVYGNIDDTQLQRELPEILIEEVEGLKLMMIHIAGKPPRYAKGIKQLLAMHHPDVLICGHSHILKVERDPAQNLIFINPGAAGQQGFHKKRTILRFSIDKGMLKNMEAIELGSRGRA